MIKAVKAKTLALFIILLLAVSAIFSLPSIYTSTPKYKYTVIIDAGHGGIDGGSTGVVTGVTESDLNLSYSQSLSALLKSAGINVIMTRTTKNGLYNTFSVNKKKEDMQKRREIILSSKADVVVSIHMNSFSLPSCIGAQAFYKEGDSASYSLACLIQDCFVNNIENARQTADKGDYFILNCSTIPSVIVECGFLSNPIEETNLLNNKYKEKLCYNIFCGIISFLGS